MSIEVTYISREQCDHLYKVGEGHFLDFKSVDVSPAKLTHTLSAFANATGGELYIGIDEKTIDKNRAQKYRQWRGFSDQEAANGHIQALEQLFPLGDDFAYSFLCCEGIDGLVLKVEVIRVVMLSLHPMKWLMCDEAHISSQ